MANLRVDKITSTETFEKTGSVQFFDPNTTRTSIPDSATLQLGSNDFTMECWRLQYSDPGNARTYLAKYENSTNASFWFGSLSAYRESFYWYDGTNEIFIKSEQGVARIGQWDHIAASREGNIFRLFVNGKLIGSKISSVTLNDDSNDLGIGSDSGTNKNEMLGCLSNARIIKGRAIYTKDFKPPMRELEVVPGSILLACQSKTDASLEKTGKVITVGDAVASELTPGILTPIVKSGGGSAITGSVQFYGNTDYLQVAPNSDLSLTGDFTVEYWVYMSKSEADMRQIGSNNYYTTGKNGNWYFGIHNESGGNVYFYTYDGQSNAEFAGASFTTSLNSWYHLAAARVGNTVTIYVNGVEITSGTISKDIIDGSVGGIQIGKLPSNGYHNGYISNLRIVNGTALYTSDFIPPTGELKRVPGTVLLCCQDSNDPTQEVTGKTISLNGIYTYDTVVNSGITTAPTPSNFTPQVGDDRKVTFEGVTKINSDAYFYLPTGDTVTRESRSGRGLFGGAMAPSFNDTIDLINIPTMGNSVDFGDIFTGRYTGACSSSTRAVFGGGEDPSGVTNVMDFVTIATNSDAINFGDLTTERRQSAGCSSPTRGLFGGGSTPTNVDTIDFITIASIGDATDFGNLTVARRGVMSCSSPVRGVWAGGIGPGSTFDVIDYVTISSTGNALDFGDLTTDRRNIADGGCSSQVRGVFGGGRRVPANANSTVIDYITIASKGNAQDFGDITTATAGVSACSTLIRGVFAGGYQPTIVDTMEYVTIASTGDAKDFGDLTIAAHSRAGCSDSHGGLG